MPYGYILKRRCKEHADDPWGNWSYTCPMPNRHQAEQAMQLNERTKPFRKDTRLYDYEIEEVDIAEHYANSPWKNLYLRT